MTISSGITSTTVAVVTGWVLDEGETQPNGLNGKGGLNVTVTRENSTDVYGDETNSDGAFVLTIPDFVPEGSYLLDVVGHDFDIVALTEGQLEPSEEDLFKRPPVGEPHIAPIGIVIMVDLGESQTRGRRPGSGSPGDIVSPG